MQGEILTHDVQQIALGKQVAYFDCEINLSASKIKTEEKDLMIFSNEVEEDRPMSPFT